MIANQNLIEQNYKPIVGAIAVAVVLLVLEYTGVSLWYQSKVEFLIAPVSRLGIGIAHSLGRPWLFAKTSHGCFEQIQDLQQKYNQLLAQVALMQDLKEENNYLRQLVSVQESSTQKVTTPIYSLGYPSIGLGQEQGAQVGQAVLVEQTLVGVISQVSTQRSQVRLLQEDPNLKILAMTKSGATGVVTSNGRRVVLTEVARDAQVEIGEHVLTLGQVGLARGLLIGVINQDKTEPTDAVRTLVIDQVVSFYQAKFVEVL